MTAIFNSEMHRILVSLAMSQFFLWALYTSFLTRKVNYRNIDKGTPCPIKQPSRTRWLEHGNTCGLAGMNVENHECVSVLR